MVLGACMFAVPVLRLWVLYWHCKHTSTKHQAPQNKQLALHEPAAAHIGAQEKQAQPQTPRTYLESPSEGRAACIADSVARQVQLRQGVVVLQATSVNEAREARLPGGNRSGEGFLPHSL